VRRNEVGDEVPTVGDRRVTPSDSAVFRSDVDSTHIESILHRLGVRVGKRMVFSGVSILEVPGEGILSSIPGDGYALASGTSMATPHVSGAAIVTWSCFPDAHAPGVKQLLLHSVDPLPALDGKMVSRWRLNLFEVMRDCVAEDTVMAGRELTFADRLPDSEGSVKRKLWISPWTSLVRRR
jgi:hypothetical protein